METRNLVLAIAGIVLIVACGALALGWKGVAEDAMQRTEQCKATYRKRVVDLPRITVGGFDIKFRGEHIVKLQALLEENGLDPLFKRLKSERRTECDVSHVCLDNLIVLESLVGPASFGLEKIVRLAWAAGYDVIEAPPSNGTW